MVKTNKEGLSYVAELESGAAIHKVLTLICMHVYIYIYIYIYIHAHKQMDHLACFVGGMFVLGAPFAEDPAEHLKIGKGIGETCYQMYAKMGSGILVIKKKLLLPKWVQVSLLLRISCYYFLIITNEIGKGIDEKCAPYQVYATMA